MPNQNSYL